jgi:hypothetical protein
MFVDLAGEHIADIMTMNRGLASIPSASSILDTSNYTFQAISYGKDADGFKHHAHKIISPSGDGIIKVISYGSNSFSGYSTLHTASALFDSYLLLPQSPSPLDTRLESSPTLPNYSSGVTDVGQCLNPIIDPTLSAYANLIGCFPAASGSKYQIFNSQGNLIISGSLQPSVYNFNGIMDSSGFLTFNSFNLSFNQIFFDTAESLDPNLFALGVIRSTGPTFPSGISLKWALAAPDCASLNLFGGVYQLGLWCLDIKEMLKNGYYPPYSFTALNNIRKYKLFAKKTFNRDLITYTANNAFKNLFESAPDWLNPGVASMVINWNIRFV